MNVYAIIVNDKNYELPKKTLKVTEKLDDVLKVDSQVNLSVKQKFEKLHNFVKELVGEENAEEMLGSSKLADIDLSELSLIVLKINDAYEKPLADYKQEAMAEKMESIPMDKIISMTKAMQSASIVQGLKK